VVPFYNDFGNFKEFIRRIDDIKEPLPVFLVIDNGSDSNEIKNFYEEQKNKKNLNWEFQKFENNKGFGGAIKSSTKLFNEDYISWMPGNMKVDPLDCFQMMKLNDLSYSKLIKAKRVQRPTRDKFKTFIFSLIMSVYFKMLLFDNGGTPNILNKKILNNLGFAPNDFSFDFFIFYFFKYNNLEIFRPKIPYKKRVYGKSHWQNGIRSELRLTKEILVQKKIWEKNIKNIK
tara:strand:- start:2555 stop:3244 length:690 start_codon:yes stop_codon:yes gene_type:complete